jgi:aspartate carbamoyltransferase catalytic subunit
MKNLISIADLDRPDLEGLLDLADNFTEVLNRPIPKVPALRGKTVVLAFFEDSTRTRTSFDLAARRLSADVVNFSVSQSATKKGESLRDTVETISAMGVDAIVVRHSSSGAPRQIAQWTSASVINAGDGWHQHPTQALLDAYTIRQRFGSLDGLRIAICGDINHSRVARSDIDAFTKLGAEVTLVGPRTLMPPEMSQWPVTSTADFDSVIDDLDVVYLLRIQQERLSSGLFPTIREYRDRWGLTVDRARRLSPDSLIMHPGPMNRGVEIDPEVTDDDRAVILAQVSAGVPIRMAVLFRLLGPGQFEDNDEEDKNEEDNDEQDHNRQENDQDSMAGDADSDRPTAGSDTKRQNAGRESSESAIEQLEEVG